MWDTECQTKHQTRNTKFINIQFLRCFHHRSRFDAAGTDNHFFDPAIRNGPHALQIRIESAFRHIVSVADIVAYHWFFAAYFTHFRHVYSPRLQKLSAKNAILYLKIKNK